MSRSLGKLAASIELSPIAFIITDPHQPDNAIVAANDAFCGLTGYPRDQILGRNCRFLQGVETEAAAKTALRQGILAVRPTFAVLTNYRKDGTRFFNAVTIVPILDANGELQFFMGSQVDVGDETGWLARRQRAASLIGALSPRQTQVLREMSEGRRTKEIAYRLGVSEETAKMHRAKLLKALRVRNGAEAVRLVVEACG